MLKLAPFDAADYLDSEETIAEYLSAALEDPNPDVFLAAIRDVARARGMTQLAQDAGLGRESLYKALAPGAKPRYAPCSSWFTLWASSSPQSLPTPDLRGAPPRGHRHRGVPPPHRPGP